MTNIFVSTYAKYNSGSPKGQWIYPEDYTDKEEFLAACAEVHADESDPEFMFQDWEGVPRGLITESFVSAGLWDWLDLDDHEKDVAAAYLEYVDPRCLDEAMENLVGVGDSAQDVVEQFLEDTGSLSEIPEPLRYYFDFEKYTHDFMLGDAFEVEYDGQTYVFWSR